jgi:hypothetical protein
MLKRKVGAEKFWQLYNHATSSWTCPKNLHHKMLLLHRPSLVTSSPRILPQPNLMWHDFQRVLRVV